MLRYLIKHLTLAMVFIFLFGAIGLLIKDPSPHPFAMVMLSGCYLILAGFTRAIVAVVNYIQ